MSLNLSDAWVPRACTLPTAERPLRVAEFDQFFREDVLRVRDPAEGALVLDVRPSSDAAARVAGLAVEETSCCSFFAFELDVAEGAVTLTVTTAPEHAEVLEALGHRARQVVGEVRR